MALPMVFKILLVQDLVKRVIIVLLEVLQMLHFPAEVHQLFARKARHFQR